MNDVEQAAVQLANRIGQPQPFERPDEWNLGTSWYRAVTERDLGGPLGPHERAVFLEGSEIPHRVLWCILGGRLRAECDCAAWRYSHPGWCAHVAKCWWRWIRSDLGTVDLDTGRTHLDPPWWLSIG